MKLNPIVLIQPGTNATVVLLPLLVGKNQLHTEKSWNKLHTTVIDACTRKIIEAPHKLKTPDILQLVEEHPEWKCQASEGLSIETWNLVE